jgi:uncharacterized membrane protein HdeD (DUF308 family)
MTHLRSGVPVTQNEIEVVATTLSRTWWMFGLRGFAALVFGAYALVWPTPALWWITVLFGVYALVDAAAAFLSLLLGHGSMRERWWLGLLGVAGLLTGLAAILWPDAAALLVVFLIATWACISGVLQIAGAVGLRKQIEGEWLLMLSGAISILFGASIFAFAGSAPTVLISIVAAYSLVYGVALIGFAVRLWSHG